MQLQSIVLKKVKNILTFAVAACSCSSSVGRTIDCSCSPKHMIQALRNPPQLYFPMFKILLSIIGVYPCSSVATAGEYPREIEKIVSIFGHLLPKSNVCVHFVTLFANIFSETAVRQFFPNLSLIIFNENCWSPNLHSIYNYILI